MTVSRERAIAKSPRWMQLGLRADVRLHALFYNHALRVFEAPMLVMVMSVVLVAAIALPAPPIVMDDRVSQVHTLRETGYIQDQQSFGSREVFDVIMTSRTNAPIFVDGHPEADTGHDNILSAATFTAFRKLRDEIEAASATAPNGTVIVTFRDACLPAHPAYDMDVNSFSGMHKLTSDSPCSVLSPGWSMEALQNETVSNGTYYLAGIPTNQVLGGVKRTNGTISSIRSLRVIWELESVTDFDVDTRRAALQQLRLVLHDKIQKAQLGDYVAFSGFETPLVIPWEGPALWTLVALVALMLIAGFSTNGHNEVIPLLCGLASVIMSIIAVTCVMAWLQVTFHSFMAVSLMITVVIGVDDVFLITFTLKRRQRDNDIKREYAQSLGESATAIFMTTLTDVIVFSCGMIGASPAAVKFCSTTCLCLMMDFALQMTFFMAAMALHARYMGGCRRCSVLDKHAATETEYTYNEAEMDDYDATVTDTFMDQPEMSAMYEPSSRRGSSMPGSGAQTAGSATPVRRGDDIEIHALPMHKSSTIGDVASTVPVSPRTQTTAAGNQGLSLLGIVMRDYYVPLLGKRWCQVICGIILAGLIGISVAGFIGADFSYVGFDEAHLHTSTDALFIDIRLQDFPEAFTDLHVVLPRKTNYHSPKVQSAVLDMCRRLEGIHGKWRAPGFPIRCWLREFAAYNNGTLPLGRKAFYNALRQFTASGPVGAQARRDLLWDKDVVEQSRLMVRVNRPLFVDEAVEVNSTINTALRGVNMAYAVGLNTIADADNLPVILESLVTATGTAVVLVGIICAILLINPWSSVVLMVVIVATVGCVIAALTWGDVHLSVQLLVVGVAVVGMGVDLTAHMMLAFNTQSGPNPIIRLRRSLVGIGPGVWYSGLTNLALLPFVYEGSVYLVFSAVMLVVSSSFGMVFAWLVVPMLVQVLPFPPAIRDASIMHELSDLKNHPFDASSRWKQSFAEYEDGEKPRDG